MNTPITWKLSERRGRLCDVLSVVPGAVGTKCYHSFKWHAIRLFNSLPQHLRNLTNCSVHMFKNRLDKYLSTLLDDPTLANNDNMSTGANVATAWHFAILQLSWNCRIPCG